MISARAPLRLSLAGGATDLPEYYSKHGCKLLAAALGLYVDVRIAARPDDAVAVHDGNVVRVRRVAELPPSLTRCVLQRFRIESGVEVCVSSTCPPGSGLGWSSALTVALVAAAASHTGAVLSAQEIAATAFRVEREDFGSSSGQQDVWTAAIGGVIYLRIDTKGRARADRDPQLERDLAALLDRNLILFRTPLRRAANTLLRRQASRLSADGGDTTASQALREIASLVNPFEVALRHRSLQTLGAILQRHWQAKVRSSPGATTPELDAWYSAALDAGALGGKVVGAGGGGHLLLVCPDAASDEVCDVLAAAGLERIHTSLALEGVRSAALVD